MRRGTRSSPAWLLLAGLCAAGFGSEVHAQDESTEKADNGKVKDTTTDEPPEAYEYQREEEQAAQEGIAGFFQRGADNITSQLKAQSLRFDDLIQRDPISRLGEEFRAFNEDLR